MFSFIIDSLGDLFWPAVGMIGGVLIIRVFIAIGIDFSNRLKVLLVAFLLQTASFAETTVAPADVVSPLGNWGQDSSILAESKLTRDEARLTNILLAIIIGGQWASIGFRNVRP